MQLSDIREDWQVFASEGSVAIGAVRGIGRDRVFVFIEGFGEIPVTAGQIKSVHDTKVVINADKFPEDIRDAIGHAHDREDYQASDG